MARRFKRREDFTVDEEVAYLRDGTIPEVDDEENAALEAAGYDPQTHRPLAEVKAERKAEIEREEAHEDLEAMSPEQHGERKRAERGEA